MNKGVFFTILLFYGVESLTLLLTPVPIGFTLERLKEALG